MRLLFRIKYGLAALIIAGIFLLSTVLVAPVNGQQILRSPQKTPIRAGIQSASTGTKEVRIPVSTHDITLGYYSKEFVVKDFSTVNANFPKIVLGVVNSSLWLAAPSAEIVVSPNNPTNATGGIGICAGIFIKGSSWNYAYFPPGTYWNPGVPTLYWVVLKIEKGIKVSFQVPSQLNYYGDARIEQVYWYLKAPSGTHINVNNATIVRDSALLAIEASIEMVSDIMTEGAIPYWVYLIIESLEFSTDLLTQQQASSSKSPITFPSYTTLELVKEYELSSETPPVPRNFSAVFHIWLGLGGEDLQHWMDNGGSSATINVTVSIPVEIEIIKEYGSQDSVEYQKQCTVVLQGSFQIVNSSSNNSGGGGGGSGQHKAYITGRQLNLTFITS